MLVVGLCAHVRGARMKRGIVAVVAIVVIAWLAVAEWDLQLQQSGVKATARQDFAQADADLRRASRLNPDTTPDLQRAYVLDARGRRDKAVAVVQDVLRREPANRAGWGLLLGL